MSDPVLDVPVLDVPVLDVPVLDVPVLDVRGMRCPLPVLRANRALRALQPGERLRVLATDRASVGDFQAFCRETGHALLAQGEEAGVFSFTIRKRAQEPAPAGASGSD